MEKLIAKFILFMIAVVIVSALIFKLGLIVTLAIIGLSILSIGLTLLVLYSINVLIQK